MQKGGKEILGVLEVTKRQSESLLKSSGNMKGVVKMTRRAARLTFGGRFLRVEIKREEQMSPSRERHEANNDYLRQRQQ